MEDLISRQDAIETMSNVTVLDKSAARRILTQLPTIEAVPVIRCKDCKWYVNSEWCEYFETFRAFDDYCSGASMMEGAEDDPEEN